MRITSRQLRQIIREELHRSALRETPEMGDVIASEIASEIERATSGMGTDEEALLRAVSKITDPDVYELVSLRLDQDLVSLINSELDITDDDVRSQIVKTLNMNLNRTSGDVEPMFFIDAGSVNGIVINSAAGGRGL